MGKGQRPAYGQTTGQAGFNATMKTDFDGTIGDVNIIPQDIGRVILNLINNAFYAVHERNVEVVKRRSDEVYNPTVSISTKKLRGKIEIKVTDNGNGIPQKILDKVFQPFFTTKPTGQGTGLGLSLSYDIVKAHGGTLNVISNYGPPGGTLTVKTYYHESDDITNVSGRENDGFIAGHSGTEFTILLPA